MLYAVQYRNMHTAIHHFAIFDDRDVAVAVAEIWKEHETLIHVPGDEHWIDDFEIHWAYPPEFHPQTEEQIEVVNRPFDVY